MQLYIDWSKPITLKGDKTLIYKLDSKDMNRVPNAAGIYVFGRRWGKRQFEALYVGKAEKIRMRVKYQLNNLSLMQHLRYAKSGERILLVGKFKTKPGQKLTTCLPTIERAFIRYFLLEGYNLVNKQGTSLWTHEINSTGKHPKRFFPGQMLV